MADLVIDNNGNVITMKDHKKNIRDKDGNFEKYVKEDLAESERDAEQAKKERIQRTRESAKRVMEQRSNAVTDKMIAEDNEKGEAAAARREYEKEDAAYKKRKEAFDRMVEARKAQRA